MKLKFFLTVILSVTSFSAHSNECGNRAPEEMNRIYICTDESLNQIQYCRSKINHSCRRASVKNGLSVLKNHSFANRNYSYEPNGVEYAISYLSEMESSEKRTLAVLLNLVGISSIHFSNHFTLEQSNYSNPISYFFGGNSLHMPTDKKKIDRILIRLINGLETTYLLKQSLSDYSFKVNICLDTLPRSFKGKKIRQRILSQRDFLRNYFENNKPADKVNFCYHDGYSEYNQALGVDIRTH